MEGRLREPERAEDDASEVEVERLAAHASHDLAEEDEARVAVLRARARRVVERDLGQEPRRPRKAGAHRGLGRHRAEARAVREDPPDRDLPERAAPKLAQVGAERRIETDPAPLGQRHHGEGGAEGLGQ